MDDLFGIVDELASQMYNVEEISSIYDIVISNEKKISPLER